MNSANVCLLPIIFIGLISFIIGSLLYDHYKRGYLFTSRSSNETIFIEQALKRIPICNIEDHSRQRALLYTFQTWTHLAHAHQLRYWIAYKTLVGFVQYYDLAPDDNDIDIFIMYQDIPRLIELAQVSFPSNYELEIHPQWFITKIFNQSYSLSATVDFTVQHAKFINQNNNASINIWPIYKHYYDKHILLLVEHLKYENWILSPIEWTFPLEPCVFSGIRVWCPAQPKKIIRSIYKKASVHVSCINGSWISSTQ